jgi:GNAT superfamily N-acetyltransferase
MNSYKKVAQGALTNPMVTVKVACLKEDPDVILGYSVASTNGDAVIWLFVKSAWRQQGIGKSLLPKSPKFVTLLTTLGKGLLPKLSGVTFNPFY